MPVRRLCAIALTLAVLSGCGPPVLDSSSPGRLMRSVEKLRKPLEPEQLGQLDEALLYLSGSVELSLSPADPEGLTRAYAPLDDLTAEEIVVAAWKQKMSLLEQQIEELDRRRRDSEAARDLLARLELVEARLFEISPGFLQWPVIEIVVENNSPVPICLVRFQASLRRSDELEPWLVERFDQVIARGLEPGARKSWRVEPQAEEWGRVEQQSPHGIFALEVLRLEGDGGELIAATDYGATEEHQLEHNAGRLAALESNPPFPLVAPPG